MPYFFLSSNYKPKNTPMGCRPQIVLEYFFKYVVKPSWSKVSMISIP